MFDGGEGTKDGVPFFRFETQALQNGTPSPTHPVRFETQALQNMGDVEASGRSAPLRSDGRSPTARFAVLTARSLGPSLHEASSCLETQALQNGILISNEEAFPC